MLMDEDDDAQGIILHPAALVRNALQRLGLFEGALEVEAEFRARVDVAGGVHQDLVGPSRAGGADGVEDHRRRVGTAGQTLGQGCRLQRSLLCLDGCLLILRPLSATLFPHPTLFRSGHGHRRRYAGLHRNRL